MRRCGSDERCPRRGWHVQASPLVGVAVDALAAVDVSPPVVEGTVVGAVERTVEGAVEGEVVVEGVVEAAVEAEAVVAVLRGDCDRSASLK